MYVGSINPDSFDDEKPGIAVDLAEAVEVISGFTGFDCKELLKDLGMLALLFSLTMETAEVTATKIRETMAAVTNGLKFRRLQDFWAGANGQEVLVVARGLLQKRAGDEVAIGKLGKAVEILKDKAMLSKEVIIADDGSLVNVIINGARALDLSSVQAIAESLGCAMDCIQSFSSQAHIEDYLPQITEWATDVKRCAEITRQTLEVPFHCNTLEPINKLLHIGAATAEGGDGQALLASCRTVLAELDVVTVKYRDMPVLDETSQMVANFISSKGSILGSSVVDVLSGVKEELMSAITFFKTMVQAST